MAQFAISYRSCSARVVSLMLLLLLSPPGFAEEEIAVLTIRKDNIHKSTTSELLPIAKVDHGRVQAIAAVEATDTRACAPINFAGWERAGVTYDVLYRGGVIGRAISTQRHRGNYSCSELCVVRVATTLKVRAPGIKTERKGFDPSGSFDESVTQYVAYSTTDGKRPYSTRIAAPLTKSERVALETYAKAKLAVKNPKTSARFRVLMDSVEPFVGSKAGEVNVFFSAIVKRPNREIRAITSVVRRSNNGRLESLFELIEDGDEDRGAPSYKMMMRSISMMTAQRNCLSFTTITNSTNFKYCSV